MNDDEGHGLCRPIKTKLKRRGHNDRGKKGYGKTNESLVGVFALDDLSFE
jgi:hypothetical protein